MLVSTTTNMKVMSSFYLPKRQATYVLQSPGGEDASGRKMFLSVNWGGLGFTKQEFLYALLTQHWPPNNNRKQ